MTRRLTVLDLRARSGEYDVFLCHNSKDKKEVRELAARLRESGIVPWLDEESLLAGDVFVPALEEIIERIPAAAVIVGRHWLGEWGKQEYYAFLQEFVRRRQTNSTRELRLIPVLLPSVDFELGDEMPVFLRNFSWIDFRMRRIVEEDTRRRRSDELDSPKVRVDEEAVWKGGLNDTDVMRRLVKAVLGRT